MTSLQDELEQLALQAWPAAQQVNKSGWVWRSNGGYTKRANSTWVTQYTGLPVAPLLDWVEHQYAAIALPAQLKLTDDVPPGFTQVLMRRGYRLLDPSWVMTAALTDLGSALPGGVRLMTADDIWQRAYRVLSGMPEAHYGPFARLLQAMPPHIGAMITRQDQVVALGLGIVQGNWLGLCDIVTHPEHRRQGLGEQIVQALMQYGVRQGCQRAWLQVFDKNAAAIGLYHKSGFEKVYGYHYRVKDMQGTGRDGSNEMN
ncbi:GNAT family N-acetyltransferase [Leeia oryzae]|uniref:GNAT family N-acetyltransferase n=1 Tax=Leeia oryzae TaxID=356662 RepID=UPI00036B18CD|nr:GNAT family N-acetyltransferase [Leeia oryzae]